jgi:uncharacterized membrane protein YfcA
MAMLGGLSGLMMHVLVSPQQRLLLFDVLCLLALFMAVAIRQQKIAPPSPHSANKLRGLQLAISFFGGLLLVYFLALFLR